MYASSWIDHFPKCTVSVSRSTMAEDEIIWGKLDSDDDFEDLLALLEDESYEDAKEELIDELKRTFPDYPDKTVNDLASGMLRCDNELLSNGPDDDEANDKVTNKKVKLKKNLRSYLVIKVMNQATPGVKLWNKSKEARRQKIFSNVFKRKFLAVFPKKKSKLFAMQTWKML